MGGAISAVVFFQHSSTEVGGDGSPGGPSWETHRPVFEQKKAKLQAFKKRRYSTSNKCSLWCLLFESIAGLSSATPYTTLALKATSKHFRCLKNAISDQLRHVCRVLGDERMDSCPCSKRTPERAVCSRACYLITSLHPYPTDTDKHMLAMQTGLSRNQVSNWFINARVRLWKPMVEEIHTLETKGMSAMDLNSSNKKVSEAPSNKQTTGSSRGTERWHPEKKSRMENQHRMAG
ncbi:hypothetical protein HPP92_025800 [Vanilla planifolia]|uniref:Homeobox domain-containing protein n=1 Tax=Vanilla planifolia TaxID=51239 RepID=A0A835PJ37_VANPL|nr:hypothetical protein HPP92_025800 [Vanilla planifolia]